MKSNEILELVRAGFTKEEILKMDVEESGEKESAADPEPNKAPSGGEEPEEIPEDNSADNKKKDGPEASSVSSENKTDELVKELQNLRKTIQASNREAVNNDLASSQVLTADSAISEFLGGTN